MRKGAQPVKPSRAERLYLRTVTEWAEGMNSALISELRRMGDGRLADLLSPSPVKIVRMDSISLENVAIHVEELSQKLGQIGLFTRQAVESSSRRMLGISNLDLSDDHTVKVWTQSNQRLITQIGEESRARVARVMLETQGRRVEDIAASLQAEMNWSVRRAQLVARDQTLKLNGQLTRDCHQAAGIHRYRWSTSKDESVRKYHSRLEGRVFDYSNPPPVDKYGNVGNPGEDYQCRCVAIPVLDELEPDVRTTKVEDLPAVPTYQGKKAQVVVPAQLKLPKPVKAVKPVKVAEPKPVKPVKVAELKPVKAVKPVKVAEPKIIKATPAVPKARKQAIEAIPAPIVEMSDMSAKDSLPSADRSAMSQHEKAAQALSTASDEDKSAIKRYSRGYDTTILAHQAGLSDEQNARNWLISSGEAARLSGSVEDKMARALAHVEEAKQASETLLEAIDSGKFPNFEGNLWRGIRGISDEALAVFLSGKPIDLARGAGLSSTTSRPNVAYQFATEDMGSVSGAGKNKVVLELVRKRSIGVSIRSVSEYENEDEVLLRSGHKFRAVGAIKYDKNVWHIEMEEVD